MIFVTVGNSTDGFCRLLDAVDRLAQESMFGNDEVLIQSGNNTGFQSLYCKQEPFVTMDEFTLRILEADIVICHAGAGTLLNVLQAGKVPVVMPRRKQYGEVVDDHQVELAQALASEGRVILAFEPDDLPEALLKARHLNSQPLPVPSSQMLSLISQAIEELVGPLGRFHS